MLFPTEGKSFGRDIELLFNALKNKEKFAFSKYADGEYAILLNQHITNCDGWTFDPATDERFRNELFESFIFNEAGYFIGVSCPCCVGEATSYAMRAAVDAADDHVTWANLFVNNNYAYFEKNFIPEFNNHDVVLVSSADSKIDRLPFEVQEHIAIGPTAWKDDFYLVDELSHMSWKNKLFLYCAGPLGNMLAARQWKINKDNTYIDIGSTLNPYLIGKRDRGYLKGVNAQKVCTW